MAGKNTRTVTPSAQGAWTVQGGSDNATYPTQEAAEAAARADLMATGGGELAVKGRDGRVRNQDTIGRADPRSSKG